VTLIDRANRTLRELGVELYRAAPEALGYGTSDARTVRNAMLKSLARAGIGVRRVYGADVSAEIVEVCERVRPYTMTSQRSIVGLCEAVEYVVRAQVPGAFVECGVWRGGSVMAIALTLMRLSAADRELYLFDTFAGMTEPDERDVSIALPGQRARERWARSLSEGHNAWAYAPLEDVRANVLSTGYPPELVRLVAGAVEETVPGAAPRDIALLRLDTDWYASTKHELEHLYPRLGSRGILLVDDYGSWAGARRAFDEYEPARELALIRLDDSCRIAVKP
jgi:hypothetical protein